MNRNYNILSGALLLLVSGTCFQSCQQDDFGNLQPDIETLVAEGRYLTARSDDDLSGFLSDTEESKLFEVGTLYRLVAFTRIYDKNNAWDENPPADKLRFNKVAWEGMTSTKMHFFNIDSDPDKLFGFSALDGETGDEENNLVSLDFYGFTYGKAASHTDGYIPLKGLNEDGTADLSKLTRTENLNEGNLNDLMRGVLLNQNITTAGKSNNDNGTATNAYAQSIMPFRHCFSKLTFQISQQGDENNKKDDGTPKERFENLYVENIQVTNTYGLGKVYLQNGKIELSGGCCDRDLHFKSGVEVTPNGVEVTSTNKTVGDMIVFPSDGNALTNIDLSDGYDVGLKITVKSTVREDIENMLVNTGSVDKDGNAVIEKTTDSAGTEWYSGTIVKNNIIDNKQNVPLHFKQNSAYLLIITFVKDAVRIITVIPQVYEWIPGEGTEKDPWDDQALGQPQMFDNVVWSDRNLGADHYDATGADYENTIGYYYQPHRNIPYFPFNTRDYWKKNAVTGKWEMKAAPTPEEKRKEQLADALSYNNSTHKVYPMVDKKILRMMNQTSGYDGSVGVKGKDCTWTVLLSNLFNTNGDGSTNFNSPINGGYNGNKPQMVIPETMPTDTYFDFYQELWDGENEHWENGPQNQPVAGAWVVPSSEDFMSVFPSTPHAGNFAFRGGGNNHEPMHGWSNDKSSTMPESVETLRVTVPYYVVGMKEPGKENYGAAYKSAWEKLAKHIDPETGNPDDPGTTHIGDYDIEPGKTDIIVGYEDDRPKTLNNINAEPDGDPSPGYASVYVISRAGTDERHLSDDVINNGNIYTIQSWGTIYAIRRIYTPQAYRMRWQVKCVEQTVTDNSGKTKKVPAFYVEVCRYRCNADSKLTETNYLTDYDWDHPAARIYFPMCGIVENGVYYNFGTECLYATSDPIVKNYRGRAVVSAVQMKVTGDNPSNAYIAVVRDMIDRNFGMQVRPIMGGGY